MTEEAVYRALAQTLDALPHGFPPTESGVELALLAKLFTPEEAALAAVMTPGHDSPDRIAARASVDPDVAVQRLEAMARKGLIRWRRGKTRSRFGLLPFIVGFYELQLPRMDAELAALTERYFRESDGALLRAEPAFHRVIPVGEAVAFGLQIAPHDEAAALLSEAQAWAVRDCICRKQQAMVGQDCDYPLESCLSFAPVSGAFDDDPAARVIPKNEALQILYEAEAAGLVHTVGNYREGHFYICNCCTCCCGILRGVAEFDIPTAIAHSSFRAAVDAAACVGCGACIARCQFGALSVVEDLARVDPVRCVGCGVCAQVCPTDALALLPRPEAEAPLLPADHTAWMAQRRTNRTPE